MKQPFVLGICGGSGSGKSTLAFGLLDNHPKETLVFHIDDYFRPAKETPKLKGMTNWDSPEALYVDKIVDDLSSLKNGKTITVNTKSPRLNPHFIKTHRRIPVRLEPKPLIIVEGFLALHLENLRKLFDYSIYLEMPFDLHISRRIHGRLHKFPANYNELVVRPMHEQHVSPSKKLAKAIINVSDKTAEKVLAETEELLRAAGYSD